MGKNKVIKFKSNGWRGEFVYLKCDYDEYETINNAFNTLLTTCILFNYKFRIFRPNHPNVINIILENKEKKKFFKIRLFCYPYLERIIVSDNKYGFKNPYLFDKDVSNLSERESVILEIMNLL